MNEVLAIIQARGGSKSVPYKNIRALAGHPLVSYSIASALAASSITRLIVSTDDQQIADVCQAYGAEVPFLRPAELAQDTSPDFPLFQHALRWLEEHEGYRPDIIVQLRPTTPLRPVHLIDEAVERLRAAGAGADSVRAVTVPGQNPYKMWRPGDDGLLKPLMQTEFPEPYNMPRQVLPVVYWQTAHVDVFWYETMVQQHSLTGQRVLPVLVDPLYCVDIDTEPDWLFTEWLVTSGTVQSTLPQTSSTLAERTLR
jgi:N-acylneuraminate cytidylyltransferase